MFCFPIPKSVACKTNFFHLVNLSTREHNCKHYLNDHDIHGQYLQGQSQGPQHGHSVFSISALSEPLIYSDLTSKSKKQHIIINSTTQLKIIKCPDVTHLRDFWILLVLPLLPSFDMRAKTNKQLYANCIKANFLMFLVSSQK